MEAQGEGGCWTTFGDSEATVVVVVVGTVADAAGEATVAGGDAVGMADFAVVKEPAVATSNFDEFPNQRHYFCQEHCHYCCYCCSDSHRSCG